MKTVYRALKQNIALLIACAILCTGYAGPEAAETSANQTGEQPAVVSAAITDYGAVMNGERRRDKLSVRPFLEEWTGFVAVKNTGATYIDHFRVSFICPMKDSDALRIDLVSPAIPSWLWKPFAGDMLSLCTRDMDFTIKESHVSMRDAATGDMIPVTAVYPSIPLGPEGLAPGETVMIEYTEPYSKCMEAFVHSIGARKKMGIETEIVDRENNIMHLIVNKYRIAFLTFDRITAAITFKGTGEYASCSLGLSIDDKFCHSVPWVEYEWK